MISIPGLEALNAEFAQPLWLTQMPLPPPVPPPLMRGHLAGGWGVQSEGHGKDLGEQLLLLWGGWSLHCEEEEETGLGTPKERAARMGWGWRREERPGSGQRGLREVSSLWRFSSVSSSTHLCFPMACCSVRLLSALALTRRRLFRWDVSGVGGRDHGCFYTISQWLQPRRNGADPLHLVAGSPRHRGSLWEQDVVGAAVTLAWGILGGRPIWEGIQMESNI